MGVRTLFRHPVVTTNPPGLTLGLGLGMGIAKINGRRYVMSEYCAAPVDTTSARHVFNATGTLRTLTSYLCPTVKSDSNITQCCHKRLQVREVLI